jgi:N-acetylglucosamine-6-sulfatase
MAALVATALVLSAFALAPAGDAASPVGVQPPNLVVIMTDDQTLASLREDVMPQTVAKLGERGTTFSQAITSVPQCCPSRAGFFTGQYAHNNGVVSNVPGYPLLERPASVLPAWLQRAGYRTAHIGKFMNGYNPAIVPAPGWDRWRTAIEPDYVDPKFSFDGRFVAPGEYLTTVINHEAVKAIEVFSGGRKPFYVQIDQGAPHIGSRNEPGPCAGGPIPPPSDEDLFAGERVPPSAAIEESDVSDKPEFIRRKPLSTAEQRDRIDLMYRCALATLRSVDRGVSSVIGALRRTGELENTMIVYTSDNGYSYGEHRVALTKGLGYDEHLRVPLVVKPPKGFPQRFRRGATLAAPVANIDIAPTILQLAGARACAGRGGCRRLDGRSLVPLLRGKEPAWSRDRAILTSFAINSQTYLRSCLWSGLRTPKLSFIRHLQLPDPETNECVAANEYELYNLQQDPLQLENLGADARLAERLDRLGRCSGIKGRDPRIPGAPFCE